MKIYFTSDLHFGHARVIGYGKRPFDNVTEMDKAIIENWNKTVSSEDKVYVLGDFSFHRKEKTQQIFNNLVGQKFLVKGNHDKKDTLKLPWAGIYDLHTVKVLDEVEGQPGNFIEQRIVLCHYAMKVWNKSHYGAWHLYGHSHGNLADDPNSLSFDVGVDCWNYTPISFQEVKSKMKGKKFVPIDHHGRDD